MINSWRLVNSGWIRAAGKESHLRPCWACINNPSFFSTTTSSSGHDQEELVKKSKEFPPNSSIIPVNVSNRNPRNLEKLRIAEKISGWDLDKEGRSYWNKLTVEMTGRHVTAKIVHVFGQVPVSASTNEWCIKKFLYSTKDAVAAKAVGEVLAHRCLQLGITEVACFLSEEDRKKEKISLILKALEDGGVSLDESGQIEIPWSLNYPVMPEKSWEVHEDISDKLDDAEQLITYFKKGKTST